MSVSFLRRVEMKGLREERGGKKNITPYFYMLIMCCNSGRMSTLVTHTLSRCTFCCSQALQATQPLHEQPLTERKFPKLSYKYIFADILTIKRVSAGF